MPSGNRRLFYGWVLVAVTFVTGALGFATASFFSLLMMALQKEFTWSTTEIVGAYSVNGIVFGLTCPLAGKLSDRWGARAVIPAGAIVLGGAMAAVGWIGSLWELYVLYGVLSSFGLALVAPVAGVTVLQNWFVRRRGFALGLASAGAGVGWMALAPLSQYVSSAYSWRAACQVLGALVLLLILPLNLIFQRQRPADMGQLPDNGTVPKPGHHEPMVIDHAWAAREWTLPAALRTWRLWVIFAGMMLGVFVFDSLSPHEASILVNSGYAAMLAATVIGANNAVSALGRPLWGAVSDRIGREETGVITSLIFVVGLGMLFVMQTRSAPFLVYAYVVSLGIGLFSVGPLFGAIAADLYQGRHFGSVYGFLSLAIAPGAFAGPLVTGYLFDVTGTYLTGLAIDIVAVILMAACYWASAPRAVRRVPGRSRPVPAAPVNPERIGSGIGTP